MFRKMFLTGVCLAGFTLTANAAPLFEDTFDSNSADQLNGTPTGWTVSQGTVDIIGAGGSYDWYPGNGSYIDMNGSTGQSGRMDSTTILSLVEGATYQISFLYGNNKNSADNGSTETLDFGFGSHAAAQLSVTGGLPTFLVMTYTFIATAADAAGGSLYFIGGGTDEADNGGIIIDDVALSSVPLPGALPLLFTGLVGVGVLARKRRRVA